MTDTVIDKKELSRDDETNLSDDARKVVDDFRDAEASVEEAIERLQHEVHDVMLEQQQVHISALRMGRRRFRKALQDIEEGVLDPDKKDVIEAIRTADIPASTLAEIFGRFAADANTTDRAELLEAKVRAIGEIEQAKQEIADAVQDEVERLTRYFGEELSAEGGLTPGKVRQAINQARKTLVQETVNTLLTSSTDDTAYERHKEVIKEELRIRAGNIRHNSDIGSEEEERVVQHLLDRKKGKAA